MTFLIKEAEALGRQEFALCPYPGNFVLKTIFFMIYREDYHPMLIQQISQKKWSFRIVGYSGPIRESGPLSPTYCYNATESK